MKYAHRAQVDSAIAYKNRLESEHPEIYLTLRSEVIFAIADAFFMLRRYDEAIANFKYIVENAPEGNIEMAWRLIALSYLRSDRVQLALDALGSGLQSLPQSTSLYFDFLNISFIHELNLIQAIEIGEQGRGLILEPSAKAYLCFLLARLYKLTGLLQRL